MPYKSEKIKLKGLQDRRRRLTDEQKEEIKRLYATGNISWQGLADKYGVSKSLIGMIVNPAVADRVRRRTAEHWKDYRTKYGKEAWAESVRNHRRYKQELYLKGELKE